MQDLPPNNMARREAELALEEAEMNYRHAKEKSKELNDELKKGKKGIAAAGAVDPYAGLTKSQKVFAQELVKLKPKLDELKEAVAQGFLPELMKQLKILANGRFFDVVKAGLAGVGDSLGIAAKNFTDYVKSTGNLDKLEKVFAQAKPTIESFGTILGKALDGFLSVLVFADPLVKQFVGFLDRNLGKFANFMNAPENKAEIEGFFSTVSLLAKDFADIFGNLFGGFGNIIKANIGPGSGGQILVDYLKEITGKFKGLEQIDGKPMKEFFAGAAENAKAVLGSVGALLGEIFKLADDPAIKETFDILKKGAAPLGEILGKYIAAGPSFANLVVTLTNISNKLTDTKAMQTFFDTLNAIAGVVDKALGNETVQKILAITGQIFAFISAIGLALGAAKFFGNVVSGSMQAVLGPIGKIGTGILKARDSFAMLTYSNNVFAQAFGKMGFALMKTPILILIGVLIAAFMYLYTTSDSFRNFVDTTLKSALDGLGEAFSRIMTAIQPVIDLILNQLLPPLMDALQPILEILVVAVGSLAVFIGNVLATAIEVIVPIIMSLMQVLLPIIKIFLSLIELVGQFAKALVTGDWGAFGKIFMKIMRDLAQGVVDLFTGLGNIIVDVLNWAMNSFFNGIGGGIADIVKGLSGGSIDLKKPGFIPKIPKWTIPAFEDGGVVSPRSGGTLALVAEAGRSERIEPLDSNGLSNRDKVLIAALSGGSGGGSTINVYPSAGMDERELADMVSRRIAFEIRKGAF
jgi:hypothetical protein